MENSQGIAGMVSSMLNSFSNKNAKEFVASILNDHPTLQQRFMSEIVIRFIRDVARKDSSCFDDRNEMTYHACCKLLETLKNENIENGLPMI